VYPEIFKLLKRASTSSSNCSRQTMVSIFTGFPPDHWSLIVPAAYG
jgi:hypothetical protein